MKKTLISAIILICSFFIFTKDTQAEDNVWFCRYIVHDVRSGSAVGDFVGGVRDFASNVAGFFTGGRVDFHRNQLRSGILRNTSFDVVFRNGTLSVQQTPMNATWSEVQWRGGISGDLFNRNGSFFCPNNLCAQIDDDGTTVSIEVTGGCDRSELSGNHYRFARIEGPVPRSPESEWTNIGEASCYGVLGPLRADLEGVMNIIRILAPLMVIGLSAYDYIAVILIKDAERLQKANSRLMRRLALVAILFFLPIIINIILGIIDSSYITCVY